MRKFDKEQPYVFISYTKLDKELVHPFVERLRANGANVWMDDLLGRRAGSWVTDVLPLVVDENRLLTLYFRSKNSLINKNVYQEIEKSIRVSGDKSVHIVDLYPHQNNTEIYTELYRQRDTIEIFTKMIQYIDEEANAYLYNDESDFAELLECLKELGVIIQDEVIKEDTSKFEESNAEQIPSHKVEESNAEQTSSHKELNENKKHRAVNVKKDGEVPIPVIESYPVKLTREMTLGEFEDLFVDDKFALYIRNLRAVGGKAYNKQMVDYAMAALLRGCDQKAEENTAKWKYCTFAVASKVDLNNLTLGASQFTWQSNSRKAVLIEGSGKLGENSVIFEKLSADITIGDVEQKFMAGEKGFVTKNNEQILNVFKALLV